MSLGIVFSGGGTCGVYQMGFWKALREYGIDKKVTAVSGSSVGTLNALLYANGDMDLALDIWENLKVADLFQMHDGMIGMGIFSQNGYGAFIDRLEYNWENTRKGIPIYACVSSLGKKGESLDNVDMIKRLGGKPEYILLNRRKFKSMKRVALASTAIPYVYPRRLVGSEICIDGDFSDKTPYKPLIDIGCDRVIILHLNTVEESSHRQAEYDGDTVPESDARLYHLYPKETLGFIMAVSDDIINARLKRGYEEGQEFLEKYHSLF